MKLCFFSHQNERRECGYTPVSFPTIRDPHLLSIHNILISHLHSSCLEASNIRTRPRLCDTISLRKENKHTHTLVILFLRVDRETDRVTITYTHEWLLCHPSQVFCLLGLVTSQYDGHLLWKKCIIWTLSCTVTCNGQCRY